MDEAHQTKSLISETASGDESGSAEKDWFTRFSTLHKTDYGSGSSGYDEKGAASGRVDAERGPVRDEASGRNDVKTGFEKMDYSDKAVEFTAGGAAASEGPTRPRDRTKHISNFNKGLDKIDSQNGSERNATFVESEAVSTKRTSGSGLKDSNEHTWLVNSGLDKVRYESGSLEQNNLVDNAIIDVVSGESGSGIQYRNEIKMTVLSGLAKINNESESPAQNKSVDDATIDTADVESGSGLGHRNESKSIKHRKVDKAGYGNGSLRYNNSYSESGLQYRYENKPTVQADSNKLDYGSGTVENDNAMNYKTSDTTIAGSGSEIQYQNENKANVRFRFDKLGYETRSLAHKASVDYESNDRRSGGESGAGLKYMNERTSTMHSGLQKPDQEYGSSSLEDNDSVDYATNDIRADFGNGSEPQHGNKHPLNSRLDLNKRYYGNVSAADNTNYASVRKEDSKGESELQNGIQPVSIVMQGFHKKESEKGGSSGQLPFNSNANPSTSGSSTNVQSGSGQKDRFKFEAGYDPGLGRDTNVLNNVSTLAEPKQTGALVKIKNKLKATAKYKMKKERQSFLKQEFQKHSPTFRKKPTHKLLTAAGTKKNSLNWLQFLIKEPENIKRKVKHSGTRLQWMHSRAEPGSNFLRLVSEMQPTDDANKENKNRKPKTWNRKILPKTKLSSKANQDTTFSSRGYKKKTSGKSFSGKFNSYSEEGRVDILFREHNGLIHNRKHSSKTSSDSPVSTMLKINTDFSRVAADTHSRGHNVNKPDNIVPQNFTLETTTNVSHRKEKKRKHEQLRMKQLASERKLILRTKKAKLKTSSSLNNKRKKLHGILSKANLLNKKYTTDFNPTKYWLPQLNNTRKDRKENRFTNYNKHFIEFLNSMRKSQLRDLFKDAKYFNLFSRSKALTVQSNNYNTLRSKAVTVQSENIITNKSSHRRPSNSTTGSDMFVEEGNSKQETNIYYRLPKKAMLSQLHVNNKGKSYLKNLTTGGTKAEHLKGLSGVINGTTGEPMRNISGDSNTHDTPRKNHVHREDKNSKNRSRNLNTPAKTTQHNMPGEKYLTVAINKSYMKKSTARPNGSKSIVSIQPVHQRTSGVFGPRIASFPFNSKERFSYKPQHQINTMPSNPINVGVSIARQSSDRSVPFHLPELVTNIPKQTTSKSIATAVPISEIKNQEHLEFSNVPKASFVSPNFQPFARYPFPAYGPYDVSTNQLQQSPLNLVASVATISVRNNQEAFQLPNVPQVAVSTFSQPYETSASHESYELSTGQGKHPLLRATTLLKPISSNTNNRSPMENDFSQNNAAIPASSVSSKLLVSETSSALPNQPKLSLLYSSAPDSLKRLKANPVSIVPSNNPQYRGGILSNYQTSVSTISPSTSGYANSPFPLFISQQKMSSQRPVIPYTAPLLSKFTAGYLKSPGASDENKVPFSNALADSVKPLASPFLTNPVMNTNLRGLPLSAITAPSQNLITPVSTTLLTRNRNDQPFLNDVTAAPWGRYPVNRLSMNQLDRQEFLNKNSERNNPKYPVTNMIMHTNPFREDSFSDMNMAKFPVRSGETTLTTDENTHPFEVGVPDLTERTPVARIDNNDGNNSDYSNNSSSYSNGRNSQVHQENTANRPEISIGGNERDKTVVSEPLAQIDQQGNVYEHIQAPQNGLQANSALIKTLQLPTDPSNDRKPNTENGEQLSSSSADSFKLTTAPNNNYQQGLTVPNGKNPNLLTALLRDHQFRSSNILPPTRQENTAPTASDSASATYRSTLNFLKALAMRFNKPTVTAFSSANSVSPATSSKQMISDDLPAGGAATTRSPFSVQKKLLNGGLSSDILAQELEEMSLQKPGGNINAFAKAPLPTQSRHKINIYDISPNVRVIVEKKGKNDGRYEPKINITNITMERKDEDRMRLPQGSEQHTTGADISSTHKKPFMTQKPSTTAKAKMFNSHNVSGIASETSENSNQSSALAPTLTTVAVAKVAVITQLKASSALLSASGDDMEERSGKTYIPIYK